MTNVLCTSFSLPMIPIRGNPIPPGATESIFERIQTSVADEDYVEFTWTHSAMVACIPTCVQPTRCSKRFSVSEDSDSSDTAFDAVWSSQGKITAGGYVVLMSFRSRACASPTSRLRHGTLPCGESWPTLEESWWPRIIRKSGI